MTRSIYLRLVVGADGSAAAALAPNQVNRRPMGVDCSDRFSAVFSALFCNVGLRATACATMAETDGGNRPSERARVSYL